MLQTVVGIVMGVIGVCGLAFGITTELLARRSSSQRGEPRADRDLSYSVAMAMVIVVGLVLVTSG